MSDRETSDLPADLVEECLKTFHGNGPYGWRLIKQQWSEVAVSEQRRKMGEVIALAQNAIDVAAGSGGKLAGKAGRARAEAGWVSATLYRG